MALRLASTNAGALTVTLNPTVLDFRSTTLTSGTVSTVQVTSPKSLTVASGATLGTTTSVAFRLVVLALNNAGTVELAIVNFAGGNQLDEVNLITTNALSGSSNSASTIYSTSARTSVAYKVVGFIDFPAGTAGTWATITEVQGIGGQVLNGIQTFTRSGSGSMTLPNGVIVKWGVALGSVGSGAYVTFASAFPNAVYNVTACWEGSAGGYVFYPYNKSVAGFSYDWNFWSSIGFGNGGAVNYIAVGY